MDTTTLFPGSVDELQDTLAARGYIADRGLAVSMYLALRLKRPLFLEGEAGVGKTEVGKVLAAADRERFQARLVMRRGSPFVEIVRYAKSENIDLIVMGTHGRGPIAHMLLGSVAEKVVRKAPCPVLTVRHPEHEFVMP